MRKIGTFNSGDAIKEEILGEARNLLGYLYQQLQKDIQNAGLQAGLAAQQQARQELSAVEDALRRDAARQVLEERGRQKEIYQEAMRKLEQDHQAALQKMAAAHQVAFQELQQTVTDLRVQLSTVETAKQERDAAAGKRESAVEALLAATQAERDEQKRITQDLRREVGRLQAELKTADEGPKLPAGQEWLAGLAVGEATALAQVWEKMQEMQQATHKDAGAVAAEICTAMDTRKAAAEKKKKKKAAAGNGVNENNL